MPILLLGGLAILVAVLASKQKPGGNITGGKQPDYGKTTPTSFGPAPSNGKDDVGDMPEPQRSTTWGAIDQAVKRKDPLTLDAIAATLDAAGWKTAAARARMIAADVRAGRY